MAAIIATLDHKRRNNVTRQALRTTYPFHAHNPRGNVRCCLPRKPLPRRSLLRRIRDEFARLLR